MIKGVDHIAIAVRDLNKTAQWYQDYFGLPAPEKSETVEEQGVNACLINTGNCYIELLEPLGPDTTVGRFIAREGEKIHHICFETDNIDEELRRMAFKGLELIDRVPRHGIAGMIGFLHPRSTGGVLTEFVQKVGENSGIVVQTDGEKIRILVAKAGLDGHDRGAKIVARALRDAGMEVVYTGIRQSPEMIAEAALQEDVDAVGLSILSGAHMELCPRIIRLLDDKGMGGTPVFLGGIIPDEDIPRLKEMGIKGVFGPGTNTIEIIDFIRDTVNETRRGRE